MERYLHIGGVVAVDFDPTGEYLLVITHSDGVCSPLALGNGSPAIPSWRTPRTVSVSASAPIPKPLGTNSHRTPQTAWYGRHVGETICRSGRSAPQAPVAP